MKIILLPLLIFLIYLSCDKEPVIYTLTTISNPSDGGTVSPSTQEFDEGKSVSLKATPAAEYLFENWSGTIGINNPSIMKNVPMYFLIIYKSKIFIYSKITKELVMIIPLLIAVTRP